MNLPNLKGLFRGRKNEPSPAQKRAARRRELLHMRPLRNPKLEWKEQEGQIVLHIKRHKSWKTHLVDVFVPVPDERTIVLDAIGTDVWKMLDGKNTVGQISHSLASKYQLSAREAEISLQQFFKELGRRGYVAFALETNSSETDPAAHENEQAKTTSRPAEKPRVPRSVAPARRAKSSSTRSH